MSYANSLRLPAIHLVFGLSKRWLLGTHHGAVRAKHLQHYLDEYGFRFNRRTAKAISHGFARLIIYAVNTKPATYRDIVEASAQRLWRGRSDKSGYILFLHS